jgi:FkbM family methyltransferase
MAVLRSWLDRPGARWALSLIVTAYMVAQSRGPCLIYFWRGRWVHRYPRARWAAPEPVILSPKALDAFTYEHFFYEYVPASGDLVVDVGAGFGSEVLTFSRLVGTEGKVIAIEAEPRTVGCLEFTCAENSLQNVQVVHAAVTDQRGEVSITQHKDYMSNSISPGAAGGVRVPALRLSELIASSSRNEVAFLKMNIEGAELSVLRELGAQLDKVRHAAICCHDFRADLEGDEYFRTLAPVRELLVNANFLIKQRAADARTGIRDTLYVSNTSRPQDPAATHD